MANTDRRYGPNGSFLVCVNLIPESSHFHPQTATSLKGTSGSTAECKLANTYFDIKILNMNKKD